MSYRKACPRTLDRPILVFGLEPEELALVGMVSGAIMFLVDAVPAVVTGAVLWVTLSRLRRRHPPGYLFEFLYRSERLDRFLRVPHLLPPGTGYLDAFSGDDDESVRRYWLDRARLDS